MKKNPGRKERRRAERNQRTEFSKFKRKRNEYWQKKDLRQRKKGGTK